MIWQIQIMSVIKTKTNCSKGTLDDTLNKKQKYGDLENV